jgi:hypothetical protein
MTTPITSWARVAQELAISEPMLHRVRARSRDQRQLPFRSAREAQEWGELIGSLPLCTLRQSDEIVLFEYGRRLRRGLSKPRIVCTSLYGNYACYALVRKLYPAGVPRRIDEKHQWMLKHDPGAASRAESFLEAVALDARDRRADTRCARRLLQIRVSYRKPSGTVATTERCLDCASPNCDRCAPRLAREWRELTAPQLDPASSLMLTLTLRADSGDAMEAVLQAKKALEAFARIAARESRRDGRPRDWEHLAVVSRTDHAAHIHLLVRSTIFCERIAREVGVPAGELVRLQRDLNSHPRKRKDLRPQLAPGCTAAVSEWAVKAGFSGVTDLQVVVDPEAAAAYCTRPEPWALLPRGVRKYRPTRGFFRKVPRRADSADPTDSAEQTAKGDDGAASAPGDSSDVHAEAQDPSGPADPSRCAGDNADDEGGKLWRVAVLMSAMQTLDQRTERYAHHVSASAGEEEVLEGPALSPRTHIDTVVKTIRHWRDVIPADDAPPAVVDEGWELPPELAGDFIPVPPASWREHLPPNLDAGASLIVSLRQPYRGAEPYDALRLADDALQRFARRVRRAVKHAGRRDWEHVALLSRGEDSVHIVLLARSAALVRRIAREACLSVDQIVGRAEQMAWSDIAPESTEALVRWLREAGLDGPLELRLVFDSETAVREYSPDEPQAIVPTRGFYRRGRNAPITTATDWRGWM